MTDLDKQAANADVARATGWRKPDCDMRETPVEIYDMDQQSLGWEEFYQKYWWRRPNGQYVEELFDLFAHSAAGALAREEAEEWLEARCWRYWDIVKHKDGTFTVGVTTSMDYEGVTGSGATLAEARALAICNAVRGMREDKK